MRRSTYPIYSPYSHDFAGDKKISNVKEWSTWSLQLHTEDEIREKILTDYRNVCFAYLCDTQKFTKDFLEEVMILSTGWFTKDNYSKEEIDKAITQFRAWYNLKTKDPLYDPDWCFKAAVRDSNLYLTGSYAAVKHKDIYDKIPWGTIAKRFSFFTEFEKNYNLSKYRSLVQNSTAAVNKKDNIVQMPAVMKKFHEDAKSYREQKVKGM